MALLMECWECNMEMSYNEVREESEVSPAWMAMDNTLAVQMHQNDINGTTSSPSLDVITSNPDLQWFLQSSLLAQSESTTFSSFIPTGNCSCLSLCSSPDQCGIGAVEERAVGHTDKQIPPEELERIRNRRERNRIAAAKCRDRRRVLIDTLQDETERLEQVKTKLEEEINALDRERERLELVFAAHMPICKLNDPNPE